MEARDVMTRRVVSVTPDATVFDAAKFILQNRISGLPVVDRAGRLVGIITEGDLLRRAEIGTEQNRPRWLEFAIDPGKLASEYVQSRGRRVAEIMTPRPRTITEDAPLNEIVRLMETHRIKRLPVICGDQVVGIVSRANIVVALANLAPSREPPDVEDGTIRDLVKAELDSQPWALSIQIDITVESGVVELSGSITDERQRQAVIVAAENIPGVRSVRDHLQWITTGRPPVASSPPGSYQHRERSGSLPGLTPRQRDVLNLLVQGRSNKEMARQLDLGAGTVKIHLAALFRNLGVRNRAAAAVAGAHLLGSRPAHTMHHWSAGSSV